MKIIVVGAGVVGLNCAHALADEGYEITIVDREGPAAGTSQGNAGWIAHTDITPLASPKILRQIPGFLTDPLGPLAIRWTYALGVAPWFIRFVLAARPGPYHRAMEALIALQSLAMPVWKARADALAINNLIHYRGGLYVFDDPAMFARMRPIFARQKEVGVDLHLINRDELKQLEPALDDRFAQAAYHANTAHVSDPRLVTTTLFDRAMERGLAFHKGAVIAIESGERPRLRFDDGSTLDADRIILAAGVWSREIAKQLGDAIPLESERGYNVSFPGVTGLISRPIAFEGHGFVTSPLESGLRIGGAVEFAGLSAPPNHARTRALYDKAARFLKGAPAFETGRLWMGHRPSLPDSLPVIGQSTASNAVLYAFGHGHYGLTQSAATGRLIAELVGGRPTSIDLTPFSAQRF
ncbi:FAD-binding oxidoreductase [Terrarubrum flagellatum]|uniref:NAD(P)/FAD-dependent oxidoreductase n=1 Tax=Terrirubrum flagellatum TaxID=2895980 RepID=UPI0031456AAA